MPYIRLATAMWIRTSERTADVRAALATLPVVVEAGERGFLHLLYDVECDVRAALAACGATTDGAQGREPVVALQAGIRALLRRGGIDFVPAIGLFVVPPPPPSRAADGGTQSSRGER